jgi:short-subunit dehydrogenase
MITFLYKAKKDSQKIESFACDVTCVSEVEQLFCSLIVPVDIIVLCAGI